MFRAKLNAIWQIITNGSVMYNIEVGPTDVGKFPEDKLVLNCKDNAVFLGCKFLGNNRELVIGGNVVRGTEGFTVTSEDV